MSSPRYIRFRRSLWALYLPIAALAVSGAIALWAGYARWAHGGSAAFSGNLLLNAAPELLGVATGILAGLWVAAVLARRKLAQLAPMLLRVIRRFRMDGVIQPETARTCVICMGGLIADDQLDDMRDATPRLRPETCDVCGMKSDTDRETEGFCFRCGLDGDDWRPEKLGELTLLRRAT